MAEKIEAFVRPVKQIDAKYNRPCAVEWKIGGDILRELNLKNLKTSTRNQHSRLCFVVSLLPFLIAAQIQHGYSDNSLTPGVVKVNSCISAAALSDFKANLESLAATVTGRTEIQPQFIERYFEECTFEDAQLLLTKSGFNTEELDPASNNSEKKKGTRRLVLAEKNIRPFSLRAASLNCRFILRINQSGTLAIQGFFYFDAP